MSQQAAAENIHLVVFSEEFYPSTSGGAHERWTFSQKAVERGDTVSVFSIRDEGTPRSETVNGVNIIRPIAGSPSFIPVHSVLSLPFRILASVVVFLFSLLWFKQREVDAIHSTNHLFHWVAKTISVLYDVPLTNYMAYTPSLQRDTSGSFKRTLEHLNFKFFMGETVYVRAPRARAAVQATGHPDVRILHGIIDADDIYAVSDADTVETRTRYGIAEDEMLVTFVGRLVPIKRPDAAIEVAGSLPADYRLLMIGDGPKRDQLQQQVDAIERAPLPRLLGQLSHQETLELIKASEVLLLTSEAEAYPTVVFEALSLGTQVVAPPVGVLPSITHPDLHIVPVEEQPTTLQFLGSGGYAVREEVVRDYSMERFTDEILSRSRELTGGGAE